MDRRKHEVTYYQRDETVIASFCNIGFVYWGAQATLRAVRKLGAMSVDLIKAHGKLSLIQVIPEHAPLPTEDARALLLKMTDAGGGSVACVVFAMSGEGFWASSMRSYLTNLHWVRQRPFVPRVVANVDEVATWLPPVHRERTGIHVPQPELLELLTECMDARRVPSTPEA